MDNGTLLWLLLFLMALLLAVVYRQNHFLLRQLQEQAQRHREELARVRRERRLRTRAALRGQVAERLVPWLPGFTYNPADARFLGDPVDYLIFVGYADLRDGQGDPEGVEVVILDVKRGTGRLTPIQKAIARAVEAGRVRFEVLQVGEDGRAVRRIWHKGRLRSPVDDAAAPPRRGAPWTPQEDAYLLRKARQGTSPAQLAERLQRTPAEIAQRLAHLRRATLDGERGQG